MSRFNSDYAHEGLPRAEDYAPEEIGTAELSAGDPDATFPEFGLETVPVLLDGEDTGRRLVRRNGTYIDAVSAEYKLLPNERVVGVANEVARDLGAGPFHEFDGDWFATLDDHVFQDPERRRVHAVYAWETGEVGGDEMEYGFGVHNSIDGSQAFSVGLFSFRHACANMVFLGAGGWEEQMALGVEQERQLLSKSSHKHTKGLEINPDALKAVIKGTLTLVDDVHATYQQWVEQQLDPQQIGRLLDYAQGSGSLALDDIPGWAREVGEDLEAAAENESLDGRDDLPWERQAEVIEASIPQAKTVWDTYNDITESIWHAGESGDTTRRRKMKETHRVFNPVGASDTEVRVR